MLAPNADLGRDVQMGPNGGVLLRRGCIPVDHAFTVAFVRGLQGDHPEILEDRLTDEALFANSNENNRAQNSSDFRRPSLPGISIRIPFARV
ncbi:MAG: hypothetical protein MZV63_63750 [Marinilabiliales bacterium]|nr:hypothetical protein [Marinilabiliales bacterium]